MMAVAKRGSAKIITPAADWIRCAQVREPTTRKNASWILRCSQMMPVRPQKTSRWPRCAQHGGLPAGRVEHRGAFGGLVHHSAYFIWRVSGVAVAGAASRRAARSLSTNWVALTA